MKVLSKKVEVAGIGWRPDFRDHESLPDIKVVRTSFFVSVAFMAIAVGFVAFLGFREFQKTGVEESISSLRVEIDSRRVEHTSRVDANRAFMERYSRIDEMKSTRADQMIGSDLLMSVGESLSPSMVLTMLAYSNDGIDLEGTMDVGAKEASELMDRYISTLKENEADQGRFQNYDIMSIQREGSLMVFKLSISGSVESKK